MMTFCMFWIRVHSVQSLIEEDLRRPALDPEDVLLFNWGVEFGRKDLTALLLGLMRLLMLFAIAWWRRSPEGKMRLCWNPDPGFWRSLPWFLPRGRSLPGFWTRGRSLLVLPLPDLLWEPGVDVGCSWLPVPHRLFWSWCSWWSSWPWCPWWPWWPWWPGCRRSLVPPLRFWAGLLDHRSRSSAAEKRESKLTGSIEDAKVYTGCPKKGTIRTKS